MKYLYPNLLILLIGLLVGCQDDNIVVSVIKPTYNVTESKIVGQEILNYVAQSPTYEILDSQEYQSAYLYLDRLVATLALTPDITLRDSFDYRVQIVDDINNYYCMSLPSGQLLITIGLLKILDTEHEVFGLLSEEMLAIEHGYPSLKLQQDIAPELLGEVLAGSTNDIEPLLEVLRKSLYTEEELLELDKLMVHHVCPFRYNAFGLSDFNERLEQKVPVNDYQTGKPWTTDRQQKMISLAYPCSELDSFYRQRYVQFKTEFLP